METCVFLLIALARATALTAAFAPGKPDRHVEDVGLKRPAHRNATGPLPISREAAEPGMDLGLPERAAATYGVAARSPGCCAQRLGVSDVLSIR
jgi:hypothetical protein